MKFRQGPVAVSADIEKMFYQVRVAEKHRDFLRFLWWKEGNIDTEPCTFRMTVHLFGAASSPSCANLALRQTAIDNSSMFDEDVCKAILQNFYVDDFLYSANTPKEAINLVRNVTALCEKGGFHLTKWMSNNDEVLAFINPEERTKNLEKMDLNLQGSDVERVLGICWSMLADELMFKMKDVNPTPTRRNILSVVSSIYDPLGFVCPFVLPAKILLQSLCQRNFDWDTVIPEADQEIWQSWLSELPLLEKMTFPRGYSPQQFGTVTERQLHCFSDASEKGYGVTCYLRQKDINGNVCCSLVMAKSRVTPLKKITIPRLELTAATTAVHFAHLIQKYLDLDLGVIYFWTDSMSVLRYINNSTTRFHTFVANRIAVIRDGSEPTQWR